MLNKLTFKNTKGKKKISHDKKNIGYQYSYGDELTPEEIVKEYCLKGAKDAGSLDGIQFLNDNKINK